MCPRAKDGPESRRTDAYAPEGLESGLWQSVPQPSPVAANSPPRSKRPSWIEAALSDPDASGPTRVQLAAGKVVPGTRYRLSRWIGEGGMGVVYEGIHEDVNRKVALKILRSEYCGSKDAIDAFRNEARATGQLGSDHLLEVYDLVELSDGRLMIAMELLRGHDLTDSLSEPLETGRVIGILRQVCKGLAAAHDAGLVHRDIKPENIFISKKRGRRDRVKLVDFGISMMMSESSMQPAGLAGTPLYVAPEMIVHGEVGPHCDMYAWGCVAYELLTAKAPFAGPSLPMVLDNHVNLTPLPPSFVNQQVPKALDDVVMRCLEKVPSKRYADMNELEAALCEAQLASGLHTPWDDLPLPEVDDPERQARLAELAPGWGGVTANRRRMIWAGILLVVLGLGLGAALYAGIGREGTGGGVSSPVEDATIAARAAAAKAYFVYPAASEPEAATAYSVVVMLERMTGKYGSAARERAAELRGEFAQTLTRLGNEYWDSDGGRVFAQGYYEQALLFERDAVPASERVELAEAELSRLGSKAAELGFSRADLLAAEPLLVLAESDSAQRTEKLRRFKERSRRRREQIEDSLSRLAGDPPPPKIPPTKAAPLPVSPTEVRRRSTIDPFEGQREPTSADTPPKAKTDRAAAKRLARQGTRAFRGRNSKSAQELFERALSQDRRNVTALAGLRDIHFERGDYGRAVKYGERVVARLPRSADSRIRLGDAYYKVLRYKDAVKNYQKAVDLGHPRAQWRLDRARSKAGL